MLCRVFCKSLGLWWIADGAFMQSGQMWTLCATAERQLTWLLTWRVWSRALKLIGLLSWFDLQKTGVRLGLVFTFSKHVQRSKKTEDLRSSSTEEQAEIWAVPVLMKFLGWLAPTQSVSSPMALPLMAHAKPAYACLFQTPAFIGFLSFWTLQSLQSIQAFFISSFRFSQLSLYFLLS